MRVAVITPYHRESDNVLWQCHSSVRRQSHAATHILVGDGSQSAAIGGWEAQHIILPSAHRDGGDTPRAIGAISALNQGFDAVAFLDADNWYATEHVESCVETSSRGNVLVAFASRQIVLSTGQLCPFDDRDAEERRHVDTSCFFIRSEAGFLLPLWGLIDPRVWQACDRIMLAAIKARNVSHGWTGRRTVYYRSHWGLHFRAMGLPVPEDEHRIDWSRVIGAYDAERMTKRFGFDPEANLDFDNDHAHENQEDPLDFLNRVVAYGPAPNSSTGDEAA